MIGIRGGLVVKGLLVLAIALVTSPHWWPFVVGLAWLAR